MASKALTATYDNAVTIERTLREMRSYVREIDGKLASFRNTTSDLVFQRCKTETTPTHATYPTNADSRKFPIAFYAYSWNPTVLDTELRAEGPHGSLPDVGYSDVYIPEGWPCWALNYEGKWWLIPDPVWVGRTQEEIPVDSWGGVAIWLNGTPSGDVVSHPRVYCHYSEAVPADTKVTGLIVRNIAGGSRFVIDTAECQAESGGGPYNP